MDVKLVPTTPSLPIQVFKVRLEGRDFVFHILWNQRAARWFLSIHDADDVPLLCGLKLLSNWPLFGRRGRRVYAFNDALPPGDLFVVDLTGDGSPPGLDDFGPGLRCELTYFVSGP